VARSANEEAPHPGVRREAYDLGPRARAILRGREIAERDLQESGGAFDLDQVRRLLGGVSRQRVERRVAEGSLLAVPGPSNRRRYPAVQFGDAGEIVDGLKDVQDALGFDSPWAVLNFLVNPNDALAGDPPIALLRQGRAQAVVEAARRIGEPGG
jgi:hypothetical protein